MSESIRFSIPKLLIKNCVRSFEHKTIARMTLVSFILTVALSCSHAKYTEIDLQKKRLSKFDTVALAVTSCELDVQYANSEPSAITPITMVSAPFVGLLPAIVALAAEGARDSVSSSKNKKLAENFKGNIDKYYFEKLLGDSFSAHLEKANLFRINHSHPESYEILRAKGYDAVITLNIEELSLRRELKIDKLFLYMRVFAKMADLKEEQIIWERHEVIKGDDEFTLDECRVEGEKVKSSVDKLIDKIAFRLASDIVYSK